MPFAVLIFKVTSWNFLLGNLHFYQKLLPLSAGFCNNNTQICHSKQTLNPDFHMYMDRGFLN
jgi:hypothetical protein